MPKINGATVRALKIPLPPKAEQGKLLDIIDAAFARADRLEAAILAKAFRGELVPQDPADEPASVLLDRIRAERAVAPKPTRGRRAQAPRVEP